MTDNQAIDQLKYGWKKRLVINFYGTNVDYFSNYYSVGN
jgi:hypothetical protein